ncbi:MAG TPA: hypothetical protein VGM41_08285 [Chitinophagaceae bacterium]|jgi:hypothetical protein
MPKLHELVADRSAFFANRVDTYARRKGLCPRGVISHLQELAQLHGEKSITGIIDQEMPPELHSSKMPPILKQHY